MNDILFCQPYFATYLVWIPVEAQQFLAAFAATLKVDLLRRSRRRTPHSAQQTATAGLLLPLLMLMLSLLR